MSHENNRKVGAEYEQLVGTYLTEKGIKILEKNFRCASGEIDLIAKDGRYLVFVEVKYRNHLKNGYPSEAVGRRKQEKISKVAMIYLWKHGLSLDTPIRFDVASVLGDSLCYLENAFPFQGF